MNTQPVLDFAQLKDPPAEYRSAPFWSWNGDMEEKRVADQLAAFYAVGMGGAFMHSRSGLKTPYMEEKWFSCVQAAVDTALREGGKVYLYDEDRYSSGFAGGAVCREHPEYRQRHLTVSTAPLLEGDTLAVFAVRRPSPERVTDYRRLSPGEQAAEGEETLWFQVYDFVRNPRWHNDCDPVDLCNAEAVDAFIALTHEPYAAACGAHFGKTIPAIFTDEVCLTVLANGKHTETVIANHHWTRDYDRLFAERFGYDFRDYLPELFFATDNPRCPSLAWDYLRGLSDLFEENFSRRIGQWCARHDLALTGHLNFAGFLDFARTGNALRQFVHWQWPGMDLLADQVAKLAAFKMTASVAHQQGNGRVVCETYGCTGWDWPPERQRFESGWQFCLGVNFRCQHLSHYTLAGWGKKDYPGSMTPHTPWFADYRQIEDPCARISYALTRGCYAARTLVLSPYRTVATLFRGHHFNGSDPATRLHTLNALWEQINRTLIEHHVDFDYGDEDTFLADARWADGTVSLGEMTYDTVLVLPGHTPDEALLARLAAAGVRTVRLPEGTPPPALLDELTRDCRITANGENEPEVWSTRRLDGDRTILFLQSMADTEKTVTVTLPLTTDVLLVDEETGELVALPTQTQNGETVIPLTLLPQANALLLCGYAQPGRAPRPPLPETRLQLTQTAFDYTLHEPNTLPLDTVQIAFGEEAWSPSLSVSEAEERIRLRYGLPPQIFYHSAQPWYIHRHGYAAFDEPCRMRCTFRVAQLPTVCRLALEGYHTFERVTLNGVPLPPPTGYLIDPDLQTVEVTDLLQIGENTVELAFRYNTDIELENLMLAGDFAVYPIDPAAGMLADNLQLTALPPQITAGPWAENGLPFYTGRLTYYASAVSDGAPCVLDLSHIRALGCGVTAGGQRTVRLCPPFVFDLSSVIHAGENALEIELIPGRKNLLGPLHVENPSFTDPDDFRFDCPRWQEAYALHTFGLNGR